MRMEDMLSAESAGEMMHKVLQYLLLSLRILRMSIVILPKQHLTPQYKTPSLLFFAQKPASLETIMNFV